MSEATQISATISPETRDLLERYVSAHGVKKSHLIETACFIISGSCMKVEVRLLRSDDDRLAFSSGDAEPRSILS